MNAWRINRLMNRYFPAFDAANINWVNVQDNDGPKVVELAEVITKYIDTNDVLININRKFGARLPIQEAITYICTHMGKSNLRISNRHFTQLVVVTSNCVATGWQVQANPAFERDAAKARRPSTLRWASKPNRLRA